MIELLFKNPFQYIYFIVAILIALTVHEFSHAYAAYLLGDLTSKKQKRLSFNPLNHIDFLGFLSMIIFGFGWAKPVIMNPYKFKNFKDGITITAFAGPFSNFILGLFSFFIIKIFILFEINNLNKINNIIMIFALVNFMLAALNILPLPILDGFKILIRVFPDKLYDKSLEIEKKYGIIILILFVFFDFLRNIWFPVYNFFIIIASKISFLPFDLIEKILN